MQTHTYVHTHVHTYTHVHTQVKFEECVSWIIIYCLVCDFLHYPLILSFKIFADISVSESEVSINSSFFSITTVMS